MKAILLYLLLLIALCACTKDFIAPDLTNKSVQINSPVDNLKTTNNSLNFNWEVVDGADKYEFQIGQPKFDSLSKLAIDTTIISNKFTCVLKPGTYQWRVRAVNAASKSKFSIASFRIDSTSDLSSVRVTLKAPLSGFVQNFSITNFSWDKVYKAKKYRFQINEGQIVDTIIESNTISYKIPAASNMVTSFTWNVKAINDNSEGEYLATPFTITIDRKSPNTPGLLKPINNTTVTAVDSLKWQRATDVVTDTLLISEDSTFSTKSSFRAEQNYLVLNDLQLSPNTSGNYYFWKIISYDAVGNPSQVSSRRKFKLNP